VKSFACADAGAICKAKVTGETDEEVLAKAVEHAKDKHGIDISVSSTLVNFARSKVKDEG
jgi:predicted small metal-binding protein